MGLEGANVFRIESKVVAKKPRAPRRAALTAREKSVREALREEQHLRQDGSEWKLSDTQICKCVFTLGPFLQMKPDPEIQCTQQ